MKSIQFEKSGTLRQESRSFRFTPSSLVDRYQAYAASQEKWKIYWYLKALIILPCCVMVPTILFMQMATPHFVWFIGVTMLLFFSNIMVHIAELKSTITVPVYHLSIAIMILIPSLISI